MQSFDLSFEEKLAIYREHPKVNSGLIILVVGIVMLFICAVLLLKDSDENPILVFIGFTIFGISALGAGGSVLKIGMEDCQKAIKAMQQADITFGKCMRVVEDEKSDKKVSMYRFEYDYQVHGTNYSTEAYGKKKNRYAKEEPIVYETKNPLNAFLIEELPKSVAQKVREGFSDFLSHKP